jgi:hypothetical protein
MNKDATNEDEMEELAQDLRVRFEPPMASPEKTKKDKRDPSDDLRKALATNTGGPTRKKKDFPSLFCGLDLSELWVVFDGFHLTRWRQTRLPRERNEKCIKYMVLEWRQKPGLKKKGVKMKEFLPLLKNQDDSNESDSDSSVPDVDVKAVAKADRLRVS